MRMLTVFMRIKQGDNAASMPLLSCTARSLYILEFSPGSLRFSIFHLPRAIGEPTDKFSSLAPRNVWTSTEVLSLPFRISEAENLLELPANQTYGFGKHGSRIVSRTFLTN